MKPRIAAAVVLIAFYGSAAALMGINYFLDPFHYYEGAGREGLFQDNARYQNPALIKHLNYDTAIVGTSRSANFRSEMFPGWSVLKVSANGSQSIVHRMTMEMVLREGKAKRIIIEIPSSSYTNGPDYLGDAGMPFYLYEPGFETPFSHLLTFEYLTGDHQLVELEQISRWYNVDKFGSLDYLNKLDFNGCNTALFKEMSPRPMPPAVRAAIKVNLVDIVKRNPDVEFIGFFPPRNNAKYFLKPSYLKIELGFRQAVLEMTQDLQNFRLHDFERWEDVTNDPYRFMDMGHFDIEVQERIALSLMNANDETVVDDPAQALALFDVLMGYDPSVLPQCD